MNTLGIIFLVLAIILTCIVFGVLVFGNMNDSDNIGGVLFCALFAMVFWFGFGYESGTKNGAEKTAKGEFKTQYVADENGKIVDTIVYWH